MGFADLEEFFDDGLHLPIAGVVYDIPAPDPEFGLYVTAMVSAGRQAALGEDLPADLPQLRYEGGEESDMYRRLMGAAFDKMVANSVPWSRIKLAAETVTLWISGGKSVAEEWWNAGGDPKALMAARLATAPRRERRAVESTAGAGEPTTKRRGSTNGTKSR